MPEGVNVEVAHRLTEHEQHERRERWHRVVEVVEVTLLAVVAVATAWTGYQAAVWDGEQAVRYGESARLRFEAEEASTRAGQELVGDSGMFNTWLQAHDAGDESLMELTVRRFTPDYRAAFDDWLAADPFTDPDAPPGPAHMASYANPHAAEATRINDEATRVFDEGTEARQNGEKYVRNAVLLASVLFFVAIAQRQRARAARVAAVGISVALLAFVVVSVVALPRL